MRLIDADALMDALWNERRRLQMLDNTKDADKVMRGLFLAEQIVQKAKAVDAVQVVRCKDGCAYRNEINCPQYYRRTELKEDYFCADGEREKDVSD